MKLLVLIFSCFILHSCISTKKRQQIFREELSKTPCSNDTSITSITDTTINYTVDSVIGYKVDTVYVDGVVTYLKSKVITIYKLSTKVLTVNNKYYIKDNQIIGLQQKDIQKLNDNLSSQKTETKKWEGKAKIRFWILVSSWLIAVIIICFLAYAYFTKK